MNGKQYIGTNAETFQSYDVVGPITGIALIVDDESEYRAGDENGYVLEVPCSYGTQQMANELYAKAKGKVYKGYEATKAALSPSAELGDGVTVNGLYSILAYRSVNFGGAHRATISAPGENVINHEYPFKGTNTSKIQRQNKRNMAATRSLIEKTASEIRQRVEEVASGAQEDLEAFTEAVNKSLDELQDQIDGVIQNWFYSYLPTTANEPASLWTTDAEKIKHLGDMFYVVDNEEDGGRAFRWAQVSGQYKWVEITDEATLKALAAAAKAQDTADNKRRIFTTQPYPPYDVGDLWTQGPNGDLMRCNVKRESGNFILGDWGLASKYTDDSYAEEKYAEISTKVDSIKLTVVNGDTESTFTLKAGEATLSSGTIKMTGLVTFENLSTSGQTTINGGNIITGTITADKLSVTDLSALKATIGGFTIGSSAIYNGMASLSATTNGVYLGTSGIALGGGKFKVTSAGALTATNATITGTINATSGTFQSVTISGSTFSGSLSSATGSFNGTTYGANYGNLYGDLMNCGGVFGNSGKSSQLYNTGGIFGGGTDSARLTSVSGTFTGTNSGYLSGTASSATIRSCTLGGTNLTTGNGGAYVGQNG